MNITIPKGKTAPLQFTRTGRGRVTVGISWDTPEVMPERPESFNTNMDDDSNHYNVELEVNVGFIKETYDLDLICLIYNKDNDLIDAVSPSPEENVDLSGAIYHSGDDTRGVSAGDDEQISIEMNQLPEHVHYIVFVTIIQSKNLKFGHILNTQCRVADGKSNKTILTIPLGHREQPGEDQTAAIMVAISKTDEDVEEGEDIEWFLTNISDFCTDKNVRNWGFEAQKAYMKARNILPTI